MNVEVVKREDFEHDDLYAEAQEELRANGFERVFGRDSTDSSRDFSVWVYED